MGTLLTIELLSRLIRKYGKDAKLIDVLNQIKN